MFQSSQMLIFDVFLHIYEDRVDAFDFQNVVLEKNVQILKSIMKITVNCRPDGSFFLVL